MRDYFRNSKGSIAISLFIIGMLLVMLGISSMIVYLNDYYSILSNTDAVNADYLAEMAIEIGLYDVLETLDAIILLYLEDLKEAKLHYIRSLEENQLTEESYYQPIFENYIKSFFIDKLDNFNKELNNPLEGYLHNHSYKLIVEHNEIKDIIIIKSQGFYNRSRKQIVIEGKNPYILNDGYDQYGLPKVKIHPFEIISYYQATIVD